MLAPSLTNFTVVDELLGRSSVELILGSARQCDVDRYGPHVGAFGGEGRGGDAVGILTDAATMSDLDVLENVEVNAVGIVDVA